MKPLSSKRSRRALWLRLLIQSHWMSSAISLVGMVLFALTGITLNHAAQIETEPVVVSQTAELPASLRQRLREGQHSGTGPFPPDVSRWLDEQFGRSIGNRSAEWSDEEVYLSLAGPGVDAWLAVDRSSGVVDFESTSRGWIAYFNDLHKGRHTGPAWSWFLDIFAVAALVFCLSGLLLLYERAARRRWTWPLVGLGLIGPWILILLLAH
ncbi:MAG: PepSY-associated TM helix domain-containing protein [Planctomycetales bacterium]|nr:PepSY-associated TM helix domain-containing protein [Planctomycetales bacterium]